MTFKLFAANLTVAVGILISLQSAHAAQRIEFPEEELASESVLPIFDSPLTVKNRSVVTSRRIELGIQGGYSMTEAFFNPISIGATASYHINEDHGINLMGMSFGTGLSNDAKGLNPVPGTTDNANLQYAPAPKYIALGSYQYTGFYGKLSLTKEFIMNMGLYGLVGGGVMAIGDSTKPVVSVGLGQKLYFGPQFALRIDLRFLAYQGPDVLSRSLVSAKTERPASEFDQKIQFGTLLSFGAVYLFPQF